VGIYLRAFNHHDSGDAITDFKWLVNASRLLLSQSSFGWWAGILSDAEVWMPETANSIWSRRSSINLRVYDNPKWQIYPADVLPEGHGYTDDSDVVIPNS